MGRRGHRARRGSRTGLSHAPRMHSRPDRQGWLSEPSATPQITDVPSACGPLRRTVPALQRMRRACAAAPTGRDGSPSRPRAWWAPAPRAAQCATGIPARGHFPGNAGFQARLPSRKPLASPCACPLRGVAFCSGTPPRSDRGCGGLRAPLPSAREAAPLQEGECVAATHSVAERLRVPTGGAVGCGPHFRRRGKPRRYKKANAPPPRIL